MARAEGAAVGWVDKLPMWLIRRLSAPQEDSINDCVQMPWLCWGTMLPHLPTSYLLLTQDILGMSPPQTASLRGTGVGCG
jgi:hypothetical protein